MKLIHSKFSIYSKSTNEQPTKDETRYWTVSLASSNLSNLSLKRSMITEYSTN